MLSSVSSRCRGSLGIVLAASAIMWLPSLSLSSAQGEADELAAQAQTAMSKGNPAEAAKLLRRALEQAPDRVEWNLLRSRALDASGKLEDAIEAANKYVQARPEDEVGYLNRSRIYSSQEKNAEALSDANKAIQLKPNEPDGYYRRADVYNDMGKTAEAKADEAMADKLDK